MPTLGILNQPRVITVLILFDGLDWLIGLIILLGLLAVLWRRKHSLSYLLFFSIIWIYLLVVVQSVFFPFVINTDNSGTTFTPSINLIPFYFRQLQYTRSLY
jgi:hypothetical protein